MVAEQLISRRRFGLTVITSGLALTTTTPIVGAQGHTRNFRTHLAGDNEVPSVETDAQGQATFQLNNNGNELTFKLIVANIEDVVAAHIHCAPAGVNGPVGVTLFEGGPTSDDGILAAGTITEPDDGNDCGWEDLSDVVGAIRDGETYVNVHTTVNPSGEIRGQIH